MVENLAAVDVGTNSIHLVVARFGEGTQFDVIAREKETVRLGSSSGDMKELTGDAIDRGIAALRRFRQIADISDAKVYAVATSAVREAENAHEFIERAESEAGIEVQVISGVEEARLIHLGVLQAVPVYDRRHLLVDIGGGSTEILVGEREEVLAVASLKLGAIRLTHRFFRSDSLHPGAVDACRRYIRATLTPAARDVRRCGFDVAVGSSGTIQTVAAMAQAARGHGDPPRTLNNLEVTRDEIDRVVASLVQAETVERRRRLPGLDPGRADIVLAGALILEQAVRELDVEHLVISDYALREGALLDALARERGATLHHLHDLRRRSVVRLADLMDEEPQHSRKVAELALRLFDETRGWHRIGDDERELLEAGALLANVGQFVSHSGHHKHSYYVIRNSDHLTGFTDHEIELIALVARYHRKSAPKAKHPEFASLRPDDQHVVRALAGILRVAIGLDRTHAGSVDDVRARMDGDRILLEVVGRSGADLSLELFTANERRGLLEEVLGRGVELLIEGAGQQPADHDGDAVPGLGA
jgi:exopolyphosphatase / guanosine-5'-triphosphate,3'-diphosphate pyrophosphatase